MTNRNDGPKQLPAKHLPVREPDLIMGGDGGYWFEEGIMASHIYSKNPIVWSMYPVTSRYYVQEVVEAYDRYVSNRFANAILLGDD